MWITTDSSSAKYDGSTNSCPYTYPSGKVNHGTVYVLSGSAGANGGVQAGYPHNALPFAVNDGGMFYIDIKDNRLDAKFLRKDNTIFDQFTIVKDTKVKDTVKVFPGTPVTLNASWLGAYNWPDGATAKAISVTPVKDTMVVVKDSITRACLTDQHFINVLCTTPGFTSCPANITTTGCNATVAYNVTDTGTATPVLTYTFTGATTGSGAGTGSGSLFNTGVTNVTITATNGCGSTNCNFTVTVGPLPTAVTVTGGGTYCDNKIIRAANGADGTIYFQGFTSGGTSTAIQADTAIITASGTNTYYFRALSAAGCWGPEGSSTVTINPLPAPVVASGAGAFCNNATITASGGAGGSIYFQGLTSGGTSTATLSSSALVTASGQHYFRSRSAYGCWSQEGHTNIIIFPLPAAVTVSGSGTYCGNTTITAANGGDGILYFQGTSSGGTSMAIPASSLNVTASGTYYFRARSLSGCWGPEGSATVVINPLPPVHSVTGGGHYCSGDAGVHVGLNGSDTGFKYQLYYGPVPTGATVVGSGSAIDLGTQPGAGAYTVVAINKTTGCAATMTGSAAISIDPLPTDYAVTGSGNYCAGGTGLHVGLATSATGFTYQLYKGITAIGTSMPGTNAALDFGMYAFGTYTVVAKNNTTSCKRTMTSAAVIGTNPLPVVYTVSGGGSYCAGDAGVHIFLDGSQSAIQYKLYNGPSLAATFTGSGSSFDLGAYTAAGTYKVVASNTITTCTSNMASSATVTINPLPAAHTVTGGGSYCAGGKGLHLVLNGSEKINRYQLFNGGSPVGSPMPGSGSAIDFGAQTAAGNYTVEATDTNTNCTSDMAGIEKIIINPLPGIYTVTGGGSYCATGAGVHVKLAGSATGTKYQLFNGTSPVGAAVNGSSSAIDFGLITAAGTYTVMATDLVTACTNNMASAATVSVNPLPSAFTVTGGGSYCADASGVNIGLSGSQKGMRYQLYNTGVLSGSAKNGTGKILDLGVNRASGTYTVVAKDTVTGCTKNMTGSASIVAIPVAMPSVYTAAEVTNHVCTGDLVTLITKTFNGGTDPSLKWELNGVDQGVSKSTFTLFPKNGDLVTTTMTSNAACPNPKTVTSSVTMMVDDIVVPSIAVTASLGSVTSAGQKITVKAKATNADSPSMYHWYVNGMILNGATSAAYTTTTLVNGDSVSCTVTRGDACARSASAFFVMGKSALAISEMTEVSNITVAPNPNRGDFNIRGTLNTAADDQVALEITDMLGRLVYKNIVTAQDGNISEQLHLGHVAPGKYLLNVRSTEEHRVFHLVIEQ